MGWRRNWSVRRATIMKELNFCPIDGFTLEPGNYCPECDKVVDHPIIGWFSDEDAERMKAIQNSGQGMPS
jgi:hypothetical protein